MVNFYNLSIGVLGILGMIASIFGTSLFCPYWPALYCICLVIVVAGAKVDFHLNQCGLRTYLEAKGSEIFELDAI